MTDALVPERSAQPLEDELALRVSSLRGVENGVAVAMVAEDAKGRSRRGVSLILSTN